MRALAATPNFRDRRHAGELLASRLRARTAPGKAIVLGLPRGGVPVAATVAERLNAPLDIMVVRKLGVPGDEEIAMGAIASGGVEVHNPDVLASFDISPAALGRVVARERAELEKRERALRGARPPLTLRNAEVVVVDDGIATGATMRAAAQAARWRGATRVICAAPVAAREAIEALRLESDDVVAVIEAEHLLAVGPFYQDFRPTTDAEVLAILRAQPFGVGHTEEEPT